MRILFFGSIFLFFFALGQDLPSLPDQFETIVELTFEDQNTTAYLFEYYDYPNDRAKFEFHWNGDSFVEILDYKKGVRTEILDHWNCTINAINATDDDENGISDHGHLRNISSLFEFGVEYNEVYTGVNTVRGIPCDTWVANMTHTWSNGANATYTSEFYFSVPYWNMREDDYNEHRVPVAVIRRGIYVFNNTINNFHFHYHFVHFVAGPVADEHFLPPQDTYCRSELAIELPELPTDFSTGVELTIVEENYTAISREFYDYTHNRFRIDFFSHRGWNRFYYFEDTRTSYEITNGTGCTSRKYNDSQDPFEENGHLRSSADFLRFGAQFDEQYQGERVIRGIPCDFWVSNVTQNHTRNGTTFWTNYTLSYYFSVQNWKMASHRILEEHRVPVRAEIKGKDNRNGVINNFHHVYDFVDFQFGTPETWNFRIDPEHGCEGRTTSAPTATSSTSEEQDDDDDDSGGGVSSGGAFGLFVFGAVVGVAIGATVAFVILKRKLKNYAGGGSFPRDGSGRVELDS